MRDDWQARAQAAEAREAALITALHALHYSVLANWADPRCATCCDGDGSSLTWPCPTASLAGLVSPADLGVWTEEEVAAINDRAEARAQEFANYVDPAPIVAPSWLGQVDVMTSMSNPDPHAGCPDAGCGPDCPARITLPAVPPAHDGASCGARVCTADYTHGPHTHRDGVLHLQDARVADPVRLWVEMTGEWWEPLPEDPTRWRTEQICTDTCHHPVHAFNGGERRQHTEDAAWIIANGTTPVAEPKDGA